ncbi:MAG: DUF4124 domain-containing protein [Methylophilaceae bacterium]
MKTTLGIALLLLPALVQAEALYKCKSASGNAAVYSEQPCNAKSSKKVILKDNTLDHSEMRNSKLYKNGQSAQASGEAPSVTSMKKIEGAGFQEFPPSNTGSSYTNFK